MSRRRGCRGSGKSKNQFKGYQAPTQNYALNANVVDAQEYLNWILSLCLLRYEWHGLPNTCSERFLETCLNLSGCATICFDEKTPDAVLTLNAGSYSEYNVYGEPTAWAAMGVGTGQTEFFTVKKGINGVFVWDRYSRLCFWPKLTRLANKLARYARTEDVNLFQQNTPYIVTAPEDKIIDVQTAFGAIAAGQPAIVGYDGLSETINNGIKVANTGAEWKGEQFQKGALGVWSEIFRLIGIPHVAFEKAERINVDEAKTAYAPARLMLDDGLKARQEACDEWNRLFNANISVNISPYVESMYTPDATGGGETNEYE